MSSYLSLFLLFILLILTSSQQVYKKVIHNTDPQAKCLDGSPGALYVHQGTQKDKFFLYFIGGGFCGINNLSGTLQDCYQRSKTQFGSSTLWPDTITQQTGAQGILSLKQNLYKNWTKILFAYCDGALHQGNNMNPIQYKDTKLYFRGNRIVRSHFKWLIQTYHIDKASKILLSGGSAGAVASILWGNYLQSILPNLDIVYNVPDCGIFLNIKTFHTDFPQIQLRISNVMQLAYGDQKSPIQQCNKNNPGKQWKCIFLQNNYQYLKGKYFFIQSQYDTWAINNILKISCLKMGSVCSTLKYCSPEDQAGIQAYRNSYMNLMNNKVRSNKKGTWSIACAKHCYLSGDSYTSPFQKIPSNTGVTAEQAVRQFVLQDKTAWIIDEAPWPNNQNCAY